MENVFHYLQQMYADLGHLQTLLATVRREWATYPLELPALPSNLAHGDYLRAYV